MDRGCEPKEGCPQWPTCETDTHHIFYPKATVKRMGRLAMVFRNAHTEEMCRAKHDNLHHDQPSNLPTPEEIEIWTAQQLELSRLREIGGL